MINDAQDSVHQQAAFLGQADDFGNVTLRRDIEKLRRDEVLLEGGRKVARLFGEIEIIPLAIADPEGRRAGTRVRDGRSSVFVAGCEKRIELVHVVDATHGDDAGDRLTLQVEFPQILFVQRQQ